MYHLKTVLQRDLFRQSISIKKQVKLISAFQKLLWPEYECLPKAGTNETGVWELVVFHPSFCLAVVTAISPERWARENKVSTIRELPHT